MFGGRKVCFSPVREMKLSYRMLNMEEYTLLINIRLNYR